MSANHSSSSENDLGKTDYSTDVEWQRLFAAEKASDLGPWEGMVSFCFGCQPWQPWPGLPTRSAVQDHTWV